VNRKGHFRLILSILPPEKAAFFAQFDAQLCFSCHPVNFSPNFFPFSGFGLCKSAKYAILLVKYVTGGILFMANQWLSWLPFLPADVPADFASPREVAAFELAQALPTLSPNLHVSLAEDDSLGEGFHAVRKGDDVTIFGGKTGLLYGATGC